VSTGSGTTAVRPNTPRTKATRTQAGRPRSSNTLILGLGGLVLVGAAVVAIALSQGGGSPSTSLAPSPASASVDASATLPAYSTGAASDPAIGLPAPEFSGLSFDGSTVSVSHDGRAKLLLFLAHWCPHCQNEVPVVQDWLDAGSLPAGVDLVSISTSSDPNRPNYPPSAWLEREGWTAPVVVDSANAIANAYGLTAFPYWVAVDADGNVADRLTGELTPEQIDAIVASLAAS
jgi:thiol-disulfide isomerase/thioredoxin